MDGAVLLGELEKGELAVVGRVMSVSEVTTSVSSTSKRSSLGISGCLKVRLTERRVTSDSGACARVASASGARSRCRYSDQQGAPTCDACDHLGAKMNLSRGRGGADKAGRGTRGLYCLKRPRPLEQRRRKVGLQ